MVRTTPVSSPEDLQRVLPAHLAYQNQLEEEGSLVMAGPLSDDTGEEMQGMGMIIYRANSLEEARALTEADPMHKEGIRTYEIRRWLVNEGSLNVQVKFAGRNIALH
ncbi:YciI family protein [bacterium]|nr:YciI family protein [bacterium]